MPQGGKGLTINRMMIATALTCALSTGAFAMADVQVNQIEIHAPSLNVDTLGDSDLQVAYPPPAGRKLENIRLVDGDHLSTGSGAGQVEHSPHCSLPLVQTVSAKRQHWAHH
jgi:hypothetical protein